MARIKSQSAFQRQFEQDIIKAEDLVEALGVDEEEPLGWAFRGCYDLRKQQRLDLEQFERNPSLKMFVRPASEAETRAALFECSYGPYSDLDTSRKIATAVAGSFVAAVMLEGSRSLAYVYYPSETGWSKIITESRNRALVNYQIMQLVEWLKIKWVTAFRVSQDTLDEYETFAQLFTELDGRHGLARDDQRDSEFSDPHFFVKNPSSEFRIVTATALEAFNCGIRGVGETHYPIRIVRGSELPSMPRMFVLLVPEDRLPLLNCLRDSDLRLLWCIALSHGLAESTDNCSTLTLKPRGAA